MEPNTPQSFMPESHASSSAASAPQSSSSKKALLITLVALLILAGVGYFFYGSSDLAPVDRGTVEEPQSSAAPDEPMKAVVEEMRTVPDGFPSDIPIEPSGILESAVTTFPDNSATQRSLRYKSAKSPAEVYALYKSYLNNTDYEVNEGAAGGTIRSIFGTKQEANLSVVVSASGSATIVQLSYLEK